MNKRAPLEKRLRRRKNGNVWHVWGYDYAGKRYEQSTGQTEWGAAYAKALDIERERASAPKAPKAAPVVAGTLAQAFGELASHDKRVGAAANTTEYHEDRAAHLLRLLKGETVCDTLTVKLLNDYTDQRLLVEKAHRHTIEKEHRVLRQAIRLARVAGLCTIDPKTLKVEGFVSERDFYRPGRTWLEKPEYVEALIAEVTPTRRDDITVYVNSGLRRRELLTFTRERVRPESREFRIDENGNVTLKTEGAVRRLPMTDALVTLFTRRCAAAKPGEALFSEWGSGNRDLQAAWTRARKKLVAAKPDLDAELPDSLTFNDLRRTFCSLLRSAGVTREECADLLGHEDTAMVDEVYGHVSMDVLHKAVGKLPVMTHDCEEKSSNVFGSPA